ncbi:MAG TPA: hypothetical protein VFR35_02790 [Actinoplanes sp.]|nr:hypothetical protein [Actinoplanes sp.]
MGARYSHAVQARLALSAAAKGVSDEARGLVSADDRGSGAGEIVERAVQLVDDARAVLERAVVYERERGASWQTIGAAIGISRQTAHERFSEVERRWKDALRRPDAAAGPGGRRAPRLPAGAEDPERWGEQLDQWVIRHREPGDLDTDAHPVSGQQRPQSLLQAAAELRHDGQELISRGASLVERFAFYERKAVLLEQIAAADPDDPAAGKAAAAARQQLQDARRRVDRR